MIDLDLFKCVFLYFYIFILFIFFIFFLHAKVFLGFVCVHVPSLIRLYKQNRAMTCLSFDAASWRISCAAGNRIWVFRNSCSGHSRWSKDLQSYLPHPTPLPLPLPPLPPLPPFLTWKQMDMDCSKSGWGGSF